METAAERSSRDIRAAIEEKLKEIEERERVRVLCAVESGSRAWGLESPDSDYDVRFIYQRKTEDYLRLDAPRDVIEWQLDEVLDINGWDLRKALTQFHRGNATLFEWAVSPIVYRSSREWERVWETAQAYFSVKTAIAHYCGTARGTWLRHLQGERVSYKKYFYALRPLLAARCIDESHRPAPVLFTSLLDREREKLPQALLQEIDKVREVKRGCGEKELLPQNPVILRFIEEELERWKERLPLLSEDRKADWGPLNRLFWEMVQAMA